MPVKVRCEIFRSTNLKNGAVYSAKTVNTIVKRTPKRIPLLREHSKLGPHYGHVENFETDGVSIHADVTLNEHGESYMRRKPRAGLSMGHDNAPAARVTKNTFIAHTWFGLLPSIPLGMTEVSLCDNPNCPTAELVMPKRKRGQRKPAQ